MNLFHIFTVTPIDVAPEELPAVQYGDYYVASESLEKAFDGLREYTNIIGASEIYGSAIDCEKSGGGDGVIVWPESKLNQREDLGQHRHWANVRERYTLLATGSESPEQFVARRFAESHPPK